MIDLALLISNFLAAIVAAIATLAIGILELKPQGRLGSRILERLTPHRRWITKALLVTVCLSALLSTIREMLSKTSQESLENLRTVQALVPAAEAALTPYDIVPSSDAKKLCDDLPEGAANFSDALRFTAMAKYNNAERALRRAETAHEVEPYRIFRLRGLLEIYRGQYVKALRWYLKATQENPNSLLLGDELSEVLTGTGKLASADHLLVSIIETKRRLARSEDHPSIALSMAHLADTRLELGRHASALSLIKKARESQELNEGSHSPSLIPILEIEASTLADSDQIAQAHQAYIQLTEIIKREHGEHSAEYIECLSNHSILYNETGEYRLALSLATSSHLLAEKFLAEDHYVRGIILANIGMIYHHQHKSETASRYLRQGLAVLQASLGPIHPDTATVQMNLGRALTEMKHLDEARRELRTASLNLEATVGKGHLLYAYVETALGVLARREENYLAALQHYEHALQTHFERYQARPHTDTALLISDIAVVESLLGRHEIAEVHIRQALSMAESILAPGSPALFRFLINLGSILDAQEKHGEARSAFVRALKVGLPALGEDNKLIQATRNKIKEIDQKEDGRP